jgi:RND family efflux transporter MFP subunit
VPQTYKGRIREISPAANSQTHAFDLRIELQNSDQLIKLGMTAQVSFEQDDALKKIIVPSTAVTRHGNDVSVWVIDANNQAHLRKVTTGKLSEDGIEINSGLKEQERIAIIGVHTLTEGMKVQPVKPELEVLR